MNFSSYQRGSSVSAGWRPFVLGPRPISGPPASFPSNRIGGGWGSIFDTLGSVVRATGDADGANGWPSPFDFPFDHPAIDNLQNRRPDQMPELAQSGLRGLGATADPTSAVPNHPWQGLQANPTIDPSFVFPSDGKGRVKFNNGGFFWRVMSPVAQSRWPIFPNRGSYEGPYGKHDRPYYVRLNRTPKEAPMPGWPHMRANKLGIDGHFLANKSRYLLPSRVLIAAHRAKYIPKFKPRADSANPAAQYWESRGPNDYYQEPTNRVRRIGTVGMPDHPAPNLAPVEGLGVLDSGMPGLTTTKLAVAAGAIGFLFLARKKRWI